MIHNQTKNTFELNNSNKIMKDPVKQFEFNTPTFISFMGIPGCGKSTIARALNQKISSRLYLECEEDSYPSDIKLKMKEPALNDNVLDIHKYFRNMRCEYHQLAKLNKQNGVSTIMDSFFSKVMIDIINKPNIDWFINSKDKNFNAIKEMSEADSKNLPDADIIIFLNVSQEMHCLFLNKRKRESEVDSRIFQTQSAFFKAAKNYANKNNKKFYVIQQEMNSIDKIIDNIIAQLLNENLISNNENAI